MPKPFSADYFTARDRFHEAVADAGGRLASLAVAARGPGGARLTIDVGWFGPDAAAQAILHSSGVHGVEAFAGSAIQLQWLADGIAGLPPDCAAILVHAVNPYGMAWGRRVNAHNVDLNRNCLGPGDAYAGAPAGYEALDVFVNPSGPAPDAWFLAKAARLAWRTGMPAMRQVIAGGQYANTKGLFFGGSSLEEEPRLLREFLRDRLRGAQRLVGIDVHTGLGPFAADTIFTSDPPDSPAFAILRAAYGPRIVAPDPHRPSGYRARGTFDTIVRQALPDAQVLFVVQEFGTYPALRVFRALRRENWRFHHGGGLGASPTGELVRVFVPPDESWRTAVLDRGRALIEAAIRLAAGQVTPIANEKALQ
jgi:Protein of unknown function (DUF2817)